MSSLLFCTGLNSLSQINSNYRYGYQFCQEILLMAKKVGLKDSTVTLIMAAHKPTLSTRSIEAGVYHTRRDSRYNPWIDAPETVQHITTGCKIQTWMAYMGRHNHVAGTLYRDICTSYGLEVLQSWRHLQIVSTMLVSHHKFVQQQKTVVIDVRIPSNYNIKKKELREIEKY